jgi:hypothetical protein
MTIHINRYWLIGFLLLVSLATAQAQVTLNLYYGDPAASPDAAFDGNVFQAGTQFGDAPFFVKFSGTGTKSFDIDSPGETGTSATKRVTADGFVIIRPVTSMVIDQSKIRNFTGTVVGSIAITVKPLSITTVSPSVTEALPGTELTVSYRTGAGTFPVDLAMNSFKVQLLSADGLTVLGDLLNSTDQYSGREQKGASFGGTRSIKATIPASTSAGTYRVRVITQGLIANVSGSASSQFTVRSNAQATTAISTTALSSSSCAGSVVSFPFSTTGTFPTGNAYKVQLVNADGSLLQELAGTSTTSPISATLPTPLFTGTYRFRVVATATNVVSNTASINIIIQPTLTISGDAEIGIGSQPPIRLNFAGTPPWTVTYTDNNPSYAPSYSRTITSYSNTTLIMPTLFAPTTYDKSYIKGFQDSGCGTSEVITGSARITVRNVIITTGPISGTYCPSLPVSVSFVAVGSLPAGLTYQAQLSDAAGNFSNAITIGSSSASPINATIPTSLSAGTGYRVQVVVQKPTTTGATDYSTLTNPVSTSIAISRPDAPRVADVAFCSTTVTSPLSATGTNLKWYETATTSVSLASAPTPSSTQARAYYVSQTVNGCESLRAAINVTPTSGPAAPTVSSVSLCQGTQGQFPSTVPNALWYTVVTGGTSSTLAPTINSQTPGEQTVYVSQTIGGCESLRTPVKATVYAIPALPTVPAPTTLCQNSTTASPLTATGSLLSWYTQAGTKLSAAPTPSTSTTGVQSFSVSQTVNGCESLRATVTAVVTPAPTAPVAANSARYCANQTPVSLTATGTNLRWYNQTGVALSGPPSLTNAVAGIYTFSVTQTINDCESLPQSISVSVVAAPSAPTATSIALCQGAQGGFSTDIPNALWYTSATGGTGMSQPPTPNNQNTGTQTVYVSQIINGCESPRTAVQAVVYAVPDAPTVPAQTTVCQNSTPIALSATSATTGAIFSWYDQSGKLSMAPTPSTSITGVQSFSVTQTANGCESPRVSVSVFVRAAPARPVAASVRYCVGDVIQPISVTTSVGFTVKWYQSPTAVTSTPTSPPFFTNKADTFTFYVTQTDGNNCESDRQPVSVSVVAAPLAPSVRASQLFCQNSKADTLTASPNTGLLWSVAGSTVTSEIAPIPVTSQPNTFTYLVSQKAGSCVSPQAYIVVRIAPQPTKPSVTTAVQYCVGATSTALSATVTSGNSLLWYTTADHSSPSLARIIPSTTQTGRTTYYVTQKNNTDNCESPNSSIEVRVSNQPTATLSGDGSVYPGDSTAIRVRLTGDGPWSFRFNSILYTATDSLKVIWVRPPATSQQFEIYSVTNLTTECGTSPTTAYYQLRILSPLATQPSVEPISVKAYPNPTTGDVSVDWSSPTRQAVTFQILNAAGTVVRQVTRQASTTPQTEHFQLGTQPAGTYFLKVQTESNGVQGKSIIKQELF